MKMRVINRVSKVVSPWRSDVAETASVSLSQKLFNETGLTQVTDGVAVLMPLLVKSLKKLEAIVHKKMKEISAVEFAFPILTQSELFKTSDRHDLPDLFKVNSDGKKNYILSPTCEEATCYFVKTLKMLNHKHLPVRMYQISTKFRDEKRPRSGLLRAKEFLMKDLYCFDSDDDSSEQCYQEIINQYHHVFDLLKVPYICARGSTGDIGGVKSHEFHFLANAGQDKIILCENCGHNENLELSENNDRNVCQQCKSNNVTIKKGIEVGHAFKLGTKFTKPFEATYINENNKREILYMSSFGLGLTRILAASIEILSTPNAIVWPAALAPYLVCIIPPKAGSNEEKAAKCTPQFIYEHLNQTLEDDVIMDDRISLSVGKRIQDDKKLGFPVQVIMGKTICNDPPTVEVLDTINNSTNLVQIPDVSQYISEKLLNIYDQNSQNVKEKIIV